MSRFAFRLQTLLDRRMDEKQHAEETLVVRERELTMEQRTLKELEQNVLCLAKLYRDKRLERVAIRTSGSGVHALNRDRLLGLQLDMQAAQTSFLSQQVSVEQAADAVQSAKANAEEARRDAEVLDTYRKNAEAKFLKEQAYREELEQDEIGNVMYLSGRAKQ